MPETVSEIPGCKDCPMRRIIPDNFFVPPKYPNPVAPDLMRLVIAEAPGKKESEEGQPLVGKSGLFFNCLLNDAGISRDGLTITNCLSCRPRKNAFPTDSKARFYITKEDANKAVQHCKRVHLDPLLHRHKWKCVYLLGSKALQIVAEEKRKITECRGRPLTLPSKDKAIAIMHPSFLNRNKGNKRMRQDAVNDLKKGLYEGAE